MEQNYADVNNQKCDTRLSCKMIKLVYINLYHTFQLSYQSIEQWSTSEVTDWLRDVGLGQYTPHFLSKDQSLIMSSVSIIHTIVLVITAHQVNGKKLLEIDFRLLGIVLIEFKVGNESH